MSVILSRYNLAMSESTRSTVQRRLATGPVEARLLTDLERLSIPVLSLPRHRALLGEYSDDQLRNVLYQLRRKGWLLRVEAGKYVVVPRAARGGWHEHPFVVASAIVPGVPGEHYVSFWSALSHHELTEQLPRVVVVATREREKAIVVFQGWRYRYVPLVTRKFFGFSSHEFPALNGAATVEVPIAYPEKAILDSLEHELLAGGMLEVANAVRRGLAGGRVSLPRLLVYVERLDSNAVRARLGFLLERFAPLHPEAAPAAAELRARIRRSGPPLPLSTAAPRTDAALDRRWHLLVNLPEDAFSLETVR
jgi:predicted transcriptional regulator of viral defense system